MKVVVDVDAYEYEALKIEAERKGMTVEALCASFFAAGCNAPVSFDSGVQCTAPATAQTAER